MNELLEPEELRRLVGQELASVIVSTNTVCLSLVKYPISVGIGGVDEAEIRIRTGFEFHFGAGHTVARQEGNQPAFRLAGSSLVALIERTVVEVLQRADGVMFLRFDDDSELFLLVDEEGWGSYDILLKGCGPAYYTAIFGAPK